MIRRHTCSIPKEVIFPGLLYCDSRWSQTCYRHSKACPRHSQTCHQYSQTSHWRSQVLRGATEVFSGAPWCFQTYHNHSHGTAVLVIRDLSYSKGRLECPPMVWYSPEIDTSKFTLQILSDASRVSQGLKYISLMFYRNPVECIEFLTPQPVFRELMSYAPTKEFHQAEECIYSDVKSNDWWRNELVH